MESYAGHTPVLLNEILGLLDIHPQSIVVDGTFGGGGHASAIYRKLSSKGLLIALDRDPEAVRRAKDLDFFDTDNFKIFHANFSSMSEILNQCGIKEVNAIMMDLGVSSYHFDSAQRGFSFKKDGPLDMRMDQTEPATAADLLKPLNEKEILTILQNFGEVRFARRIAKAIAGAKRKNPICRTGDLHAIILEAIPAYARHGKTDPSPNVFQAFRIALNRELDVLETAIHESISLLAPGGRLCVISFHSLEDRIVKNIIRDYKKEGRLRVLTKKPVTPGTSEVQSNPRSRSAKLRAVEKI